MADMTMCKDWGCPNQDNCWRLLAPPKKPHQMYQDFKFDYDAYETSDNKNHGCDFYIAMDELEINSEVKENDFTDGGSIPKQGTETIINIS